MSGVQSSSGAAEWPFLHLSWFPDMEFGLLARWMWSKFWSPAALAGSVPGYRVKSGGRLLSKRQVVSSPPG